MAKAEILPFLGRTAVHLRRDIPLVFLRATGEDIDMRLIRSGRDLLVFAWLFSFPSEY